MRLAIVGDRNYTDYKKFTKQVDKFIEKHGTPSIIISGGASGVDTLAEKYAKKHKIPTRIFPAEWEIYGRSAGPKRNIEIVNASTHVLAFLTKGSKGTASTIRIAEAARTPRTIIKLEEL